MNIIVLIIDSNDLELYKELRTLWKLYMNLNTSIKCFFLYGQEDLKTEVQEQENNLTIRVKESLQPGIYEKTSLALNYLINTYPNTNYFIRTNISSFWVWDMLLEFVKNKPMQNYISSPNNDFPSGCGMIMTKDVAQLWANNYNSHTKYIYLDDVAFGHVLMNNNINISIGYRYDIIELFSKNLICNYTKYVNNYEYIYKMLIDILENIPENTYHVRLKLGHINNRICFESKCLEYLIKKHYLIGE
jgi:hypothetical protein